MGDIEQARHIVELMVLTAWADGKVEGSEALTIHKLTISFPELREVGPTGEIMAPLGTLDEDEVGGRRGVHGLSR